MCVHEYMYVHLCVVTYAFIIESHMCRCIYRCFSINYSHAYTFLLYMFVYACVFISRIPEARLSAYMCVYV